MPTSWVVRKIFNGGGGGILGADDAGADDAALLLLVLLLVLLLAVLDVAFGCLGALVDIGDVDFIVVDG